MAFKDLLNEVDKLEKDIRKKYPKQRGRVLIANAKEITDYAVGKEADEFTWLINYRRELVARL
jgi:hypothetical protein